jgi:Cu(I)/Ag(I) efflux system membrane fusion protein
MTVRKGDHMVSMYSPELLATQEELLQAKKAVKALGNTNSKVLRSTADFTLEAAREKLRLFGLTEGQITQIESSGKTSDHLTIYAPIGGVVVQKHALEGMYVQTGTSIYTIADLTQLWVMLEAYESDLPWLRYGQKVSFTSPSFPGQTFEALISFIDPVVDPKTRSVRVRAIVENRNQELKPDMFVHGVVVTRVDGDGDVIDENLAGKWISPMHPEVVKDRPGSCDVCGMPLVAAESLGYAARGSADENAPLLIPASAPLITGKRAVVYVELSDDDGPLFEGREVELGPRAGDSYVVMSGLKEGELVVTNGAFKIDSELQIQAKPSMMSPDGGAPLPGHQHGARSGEGEEMAGQTAPARMQESEDVLDALEPVYDAYFGVQMALANDDHDKAKTAAREVEEAVKKVDMNLFSHSGHEMWMDISKTVISATQKTAESGDIEAARDGFFFLSNATIELHDSFGHKGEGNYYLTFCPMARGNAGAFWLQTENVVWNSFYGASMLRCGEIKKNLPPASEDTE